jgi:capsular exopolysaccharide synthesis family protein
LAQYDINLREYWRILKKRKWIVLFVGIVLGVFSTAFAVFKAPPSIYTSVCSIKFEKETTVEGLYAKTITWSGGDDIATQISVIKSFTVFEKVAQRLGLLPKGVISGGSSVRGDVAKVVDDLQSKVEVTRQGMTNILNIQVKDRDPVFAQKLANTVAGTYKDLHSELQMKRMLEAIRYIEEQLVQVRQRLREAEEEFNRFTQNNQLLSIDIQSEKLLARSQEVQNGVRKLVETKGELQNIVGRLEKYIANSSVQGNFYTGKGTPQYQSSNDLLTELHLKRETLLKDFTPLHPEVVEVGRRLLEVAQKMRLLLLSQIGDLEKQEEGAKGEAKDLESKGSVLMEKKLEYDRLKRKVELYNDMTTLLERKNQEALIKKAEKPEEVTVVKPALLPAEPINPPRSAATGAMGLIIGLVLGLIVAFIVETFDTSIGAIEDVEETLKTKVLGVIPQADAKELHETFKGKASEGMGEISPEHVVTMAVHYVPKSMMAESFRGLRTNIQFKDAANEIKTIAVTSASPQEGKTIVSVNLAMTMAQAGMKTLLIGSDMRKPRIARIFGVEQTPGLSEILLGNCAWRDAVQTVTDMMVGKLSLDEVLLTPGLDNLHLIVAGSIPPNPAELVESRLLKEFIEEAKGEYDVILFDTPPILSTADAAILSSKTDGVLLVYRVGAVSRGLLKRSTAQLEQVNCRMLGVVLNGMKPEVSPDFHSFKYYKYYSSYGEEGKKRGEGISTWGKAKKKRKTGRTVLTLTVAGLGLLFFGGGFVWQSGIMGPVKAGDSIKPEPEKTVQRAAKKLPQELPTPAAPTNPGADKPEAAKLAVDTPPAQSRQPETTPQTVPEEKNTIAALPVKEEASAPAPTTPVPEMKKETKESVLAAAPVDKESTGVSKGEMMRSAIDDSVAPPSAQSVRKTPYPYSVFLSSVPDIDLAKETVSQWRARGLVPYHVKVVLSQGEQYWIYVGCFESWTRAETFMRDNELVGAIIRKTPYANTFGVYDSLEQVLSQHQKLKDLGYSSYYVEAPQGKYRLFVGAYLQKERATKQGEELKSKGIENQVVLR